MSSTSLPHQWSVAPEPSGLTAAARAILWRGRLVARLEQRWGRHPMLFRAALEQLAIDLREHNPHRHLWSPEARLACEASAAAAVDDALTEIAQRER